MLKFKEWAGLKGFFYFFPGGQIRQVVIVKAIRAVIAEEEEGNYAALPFF